MGALSTSLLVGSAILQGGAQLAGAAATRRAGRENARFADAAAEDAIARGEESAERYGMDLSRLLGSQRAIIAGAQGLDPNQGTAAQLREQTERFGEQDIATIRLNAAREAWGIRTQAGINQRAANAQANAMTIGAAGTLLGGGVDAWQNYASRRGPQMSPQRLNTLTTRNNAAINRAMERF